MLCFPAAMAARGVEVIERARAEEKRGVTWLRVLVAGTVPSAGITVAVADCVVELCNVCQLRVGAGKHRWSS